MSRHSHFLLIGTLLISTLLAGYVAPAQPADAPARTLDSLRALARQPALPDSVRIPALINLGLLTMDADFPASRRYFQEVLRVSQAHHNVRGELVAYSSLARQSMFGEDFVAATRDYQALSRRARRHPGVGDKYVADAYLQLANIARLQGDYEAGEAYLRQADGWLRTHPGLPFDVRELSAGAHITFYADLLKDPARATDTVCARLEQAADELDRVSRQNPFKLFLPAQQAAVAFGRGMAASYRHQPDSALTQMRRAVALSEKVGLVAQLALCLGEQAQLEHEANHYAEAERLSRRTLALARQTQQPYLLTAAYKQRAQTLAALGRYPEAYHAATRAQALTDSLFPAQKRVLVSRLEVQFGTERKERQIQQLSQQQKLQASEVARQQQRVWGLAAVLAAVLAGLALAATLYARVRRQRAQLAEQYAELAQARATQDRLYALIAHDLRSPVVAFTGLADLLNRYVSKGDTERLAGLGGRIRQAAQNLSELLDNLLNWAVSQRGELVPQPRPLRATELLTDIAALYRNAAEAADVTLTVETADADLQVQADPDMTRTILRNLAGNALKATPAGGRVALWAERGADGRAVLRVLDTGPGLPAEALDRLNAATPTMRVAGRDSGAGLGLLLSRFFAEAQGGALRLANATVGGAEATLTLPLAA